MMEPTPDTTDLLEMIAAHLDIPKSYYEKAASRHRSVGEWMSRPESGIARFKPDVRPQGSFRYGTVIQPLNPLDEFDLDNVCMLCTLGLDDLTQEQLKAAYGKELRGYANAHGMLRQVEEHNRCWRLTYADEVGFHLDSVPSIPAPESVTQQLLAMGLSDRFARTAIAITDRRHPEYRVLCTTWPVSNPRGFARWFESQAALGRVRMPQFGDNRAAVVDVPSYEWKTTLQRSIQILKRHRDVMFRSAPDLAPISMIITNLAACAYSGEANLGVALTNIVVGMARFVRPTIPRIPNPVFPAEDYADKWSKNPDLERKFWLWHTAVVADLKRLQSSLLDGSSAAQVEKVFAVTLRDNERQQLVRKYARATPVAAPLVITSAPKPWGCS